MQWILENGSSIGALSNLVLVLIWAAYLQLFYMAYRRRRRPMILINRGKGLGPGSHCLVSNMSEEPIYALCIVAKVEENGRSWLCAITDDEDVTEGKGTSPQTHQGPLKTGEFMDVGSFEKMIDRAGALKSSVRNADPQGECSAFDAIEVKVIALYASSARFIGASRRFERFGEHGELYPTSLETQQLAGRRARRELKQLLRHYL